MASDLGIAHSIRDNVTSILSQRGLHYDPVGNRGSWLWCLGGPELYRRPMTVEDAEYADIDTCLDLNVWVCEEHEVISAELWPYDLVAESGGTGIDDPLRSDPILLSNDTRAAATEFLRQLEIWLDEILDLSGEASG